ncbi:MAG: hypothetical protein RLZZ466_935 [Bacteroidota bacterium]|jgi:iron complex outermembrane receptor protein
MFSALRVLALGVFFVFGLVFLATAQAGKGYSLAGRISNAATGEKLQGAVLYLSDLKRSVLSDENGDYIFSEIYAGHHVLEISHTGFATIVLHIELNNTLQRDIRLSPIFVENQGVVVTGISSPTSIRKTPTPITIFKQSDLQQSTSSNIVDALSKVPGVAQLTTGPAISKPIIRGLGSNRVVVVNDGIRQEGQQWGDEHGLEIDELSVNRVEILKGPSSLLYGSDALAGVIHFQSAPPVEEGTMKGRIVSNYQTNGNLYNTHVQIGGNNKGFNWSSYGSLKSAADYSNKYDRKVLNSRFNEMNAGGHIGINKKWGYAHLLVSSFNQHLGVVEGERDDATGNFILYGGTSLERVASESDLKGRAILVPNQQVQHFKLVSDNSVAIGKSRLKVGLGWQQNLRKEFGEPEEPKAEELYFDLSTFNYTLHWQLPEKNEWHTTVGVNGMQQQNINRGEERLIPDYSLFDAGFFLFTQRLQNKVSWSGGLRFDSRAIEGSAYEENGQLKFSSFKKNFSNWSGSMGVSYEPTSTVVIKANVARGFRAPSLSELASNGAHEGTNRYEYGRLDLRSETSLQGDLGLELQFEHFGIELNTFYNQINDFIFYRKLYSVGGGDSTLMLDGEELTAFAFQQNTAQLHGLELNMDIHPHPLDWLHIENSFSLVRGKFNSDIDPDIAGSNQLPLMPAPRWNGEIRGDFQKGWGSFRQVYVKLAAQQTFSQDRFFTGFNTETRTPSYLLIDAGAGFSMINRNKKTVATIHLAATNLGDVAWQSHTSRLKYTAENLQTGRMGVFNRGRNFSIRVVVPFRWEQVR